MNNNTINRIARTAIIAALYAVVTLALAPISYGIIGEQVYSFVPSQMDGIVCEAVCMWD